MNTVIYQEVECIVASTRHSTAYWSISRN